MPRVYFPTSNHRRIAVEKGGGGGSHHISDDTYKIILNR